MYFFPTWFQTVALTNASTAGLHLLPNSIALSIGSLFAGLGIVLITIIHENSGPLQTWFSIVIFSYLSPTVAPVALLAHLPESLVAVGTGFGQVFRGLGQVCGVAVSSALFQSILNSELHARIHTPDADEVVSRIRHSTTLIARLPPDLQRVARDSYAVSLRAVFFLAACSTLLAYIIRLPIPEKKLEYGGRRKVNDVLDAFQAEAQTSRPASTINSYDESEAVEEGDELAEGVLGKHVRRPRRRLSGFESIDETVDPDMEQDRVTTVTGGAANRKEGAPSMALDR